MAEIQKMDFNREWWGIANLTTIKQKTLVDRMKTNQINIIEK